MALFPLLAPRNGSIRLKYRRVCRLLGCGNLGSIMRLLMLVMFNRPEVLRLLLSEVEGNLFVIFRYYLWNDQPEIGYHVIDSFLKGTPL